MMFHHFRILFKLLKPFDWVQHHTAEYLTLIGHSAEGLLDSRIDPRIEQNRNHYFVYTNSLAYSHISMLSGKFWSKGLVKNDPKMTSKWSKNSYKIFNWNWPIFEKAFKDGSELMFDYLFFTPPGKTLKNMNMNFIPEKQRKAFDFSILRSI